MHQMIHDSVSVSTFGERELAPPPPTEEEDEEEEKTMERRRKEGVVSRVLNGKLFRWLSISAGVQISLRAQSPSTVGGAAEARSS